MTHFLSRLVDRARGTAARVEPLIRSRFAPAGAREQTSEVDVPRSTGADDKTAAAAPREARVRSGGESAVRPATASDADDARLEEIPLLVPQHSVPGRDSDGPPDVVPRTHAGDPPAARTAAVASRKAARAIGTARTAQAKPHGAASLNISNGGEHDRAPVVRVTIGRIDVRAAPAPASPQRKPATGSKPALPLDAYLKARKEGAR